MRGEERKEERRGRGLEGKKPEMPRTGIGKFSGDRFGHRESWGLASEAVGCALRFPASVRVGKERHLTYTMVPQEHELMRRKSLLPDELIACIRHDRDAHERHTI